jgi:amino acid permease
VPSIISSPPWGESGFLLDRRLAVVAAAVAVYPLAIPADISALRYTAIITPVVLLITIIIVWVEVPSRLDALREAGDEIVWFNWDLKSWLTAVPIMVNAFCNQQNAVPAAFALTKPSVARIVKATVHGNLVVTLVLLSMGVGGYLCWGPHTKGDFVLNFVDAGGYPGIWVCRVLLSISMYFVIPLALQPASKSCAQIFLSFSSRGEHREVSRALHICSSTFCLCMCTGVAVGTNDISSVIGVLGGVLATSVMFWFPLVIYVIALWPTQPRCCRHAVAASICFFGICGFVSVGLMFVK